MPPDLPELRILPSGRPGRPPAASSPLAAGPERVPALEDQVVPVDEAQALVGLPRRRVVGVHVEAEAGVSGPRADLVHVLEEAPEDASSPVGRVHVDALEPDEARGPP